MDKNGNGLGIIIAIVGGLFMAFLLTFTDTKTLAEIEAGIEAEKDSIRKELILEAEKKVMKNINQKN